MTSVRRSLAFSFASKYAELLLALASTLILARLLTPEEIGIFSVVSVLVAAAHMLRDFGVAQYIVQERELDEHKVHSALAVTATLAWIAAVALFALSWPIAGFYDEPGVGSVMRVLAINFLIIPFNSITLDLLNRDMRFDHLLWIKLVAAAVHAVTSVALAWLGFSYMALAWGAVANVLATTIMATWFRPAGVSFRLGFRHYRDVLRFGTFASVASLSRTVGEAAPDLVIGKLIGMSGVGLFSRAMGTINLFSRSVLFGVKPVVLPHFSRRQRAGEGVADAYLESIVYLTALGWPFFAMLALLAQPTVRTLYGDQWGAAAPLVQILCLGGALQIVQIFSGEMLVAAGRVGRDMKVQLAVQGITVAAVIVGATFSLAAVAWAWVLGAIVGQAALMVSVFPVVGVAPAAFARVVARGLWVTGLTVAPSVALIALELLPSSVDSSIAGLKLFAIVVPMSVLAWLVALAATRHPLGGEIAQLARRVRGRIG